jgi:Uma2 family endonuclease
MDTSLLRQIEQSPMLVLFQQRINALIESESARRERFYEEMTEQEKVEFINGEVVVHSPVKLEHNDASGNLYTLLKVFVQRHHLGFVGHEKILVTLTRNDYEPDVCFFRSEIADGFSPKQMKFPAPDFAAEVLSPSTEDIDRTVKFADYAAHGVREYWILDPATKMLEQYVSTGDEFELRLKSDNGTVASIAVAGFEIPIRALFDADENHRALGRLLTA